MKKMFDKLEFDALKEKYGIDAKHKKVTLKFINQKFFNEFKHNVNNNRRGEVAFFIQRKNGKFILIRTSFYPEGIFRVPTGGINYGENIEEALFREVKEELGLDVFVNKFLGVIEYNIIFGNEELKFYSYVFWLKEVSGNILEDATEDEISEYIEADKSEMLTISKNLAEHCGKWKDWCKFRAETTKFIIPFI